MSHALQDGFILLPVSLALTILAAVAFLMNRETAMGLRAAAGDYQADQARYTAEAGLHHALFDLAAAGCAGGAGNLPVTAFGPGSYTTAATATGDTITVKAKGTVGGVIRSLSRRLPFQATPSQAVLDSGTQGRDTYLDSKKNLENFGADTPINVTNKSGDLQHGLIWFDLSGVPFGATVSAAVLGLNFEGMGSENSGTLTAHRVTRSWVEGTGGWSGGCGDGASWLNYHLCSPWAVPGGDHAAAVTASAFVDDAVPGPFTMDLTNLVSDWVGGAYPNYGLLLKAGAGMNNAKLSSGEHADPALRPTLTIDYSCGCGATCVFGPLTYRDELAVTNCDAGDYAGSDGSLDWSASPWTEVGESNGSCNGAVKLASDLGEDRLRFKDDARGIERAADLVAFPFARLSFDYRRDALPDAGAYLAVEVSDDGGASWFELDRLAGPATDLLYQSAVYDLTSYRAGNTRIRFMARGLTGGFGPAVYVDTVEIDTTETAPTGPETVTLVPVADTWIDEEHDAANHGSDDRLNVGQDADKADRRGLYRFDLSPLPASATVLSATLRLYSAGYWGSHSIEVGIYPLDSAWDETATWDSLDGGNFDPVQQVGVTWVPASSGWTEWDITPPLLHEWLDWRANHGLILVELNDKKNTWTLPTTREHADAALHPELVVEYLP